MNQDWMAKSLICLATIGRHRTQHDLDAFDYVWDPMLYYEENLRY